MEKGQLCQLCKSFDYNKQLSLPIFIRSTNQDEKEGHIYDADKGGPEYEVIHGGLAGRSKAPREEIALKECPAYIPTAVSGGNSGVEGEGGALYETVATT